jgi:hypothetical protein
MKKLLLLIERRKKVIRMLREETNCFLRFLV